MIEEAKVAAKALRWRTERVKIGAVPAAPTVMAAIFTKFGGREEESVEAEIWLDDLAGVEVARSFAALEMGGIPVGPLI